MTKPRISDDGILAALRAVGGNRTAAALQLGIHVRALHNRITKLTASGIVVPDALTNHTTTATFASTDASTNARLSDLKRQVRVLTKAGLDEQRVLDIIGGLRQKPVSPPVWLSAPRTKVTDLTGVPTVFASDWHWGEVVRPEEIGGVNEYGLAIARTRARTFIQVAIDLLMNHLAKPRYDGCVFALGGDMVSGDIHDELKQTNEVEVAPAVVDLAGVLVWCIRTLTDAFGRLYVPCVTGNHGRMTRKPIAKRRNYSNFDWLLYQMVASEIAGDKQYRDKVHFNIAPGAEILYRVYGTRYMFHHGDQFRGGDGFAGAAVPIARGDRKKRSRGASAEYDVMMLGHWHQSIQTGRYFVNGSLKGYDEWVMSMNFEYEPPKQWIWVTHPEHSVTFSMPVYCDRIKKAEARTEWVSVVRGVVA